MHSWLKVSVFKNGRNVSRYKEVVIEGMRRGGGRHLNKMNLMKYCFKQKVSYLLRQRTQIMMEILETGILQGG